MRIQNASCEKENRIASSQNARTIAGLDEVGRGAISGPLVVGCFVRKIAQTLPRVRDSKMLTPRARRALVPKLFLCATEWSLGVVEASEINENGMGWAVPEAFRRALAALPTDPDILFYDGKPQSFFHPSAHAIIHGDQTHATISAASIIAKVIRDLFMQTMDEDYPQYHFSSHKGYGTRLHKKALKTFDSIEGIHRTQFVKTFLS